MPGTFSTDLTTLSTADATTGWTAVGNFSVPPRTDNGVKIQGTNGLTGSGPSSANATVWYKNTFTSTNLTDGRHIYAWFMISSLGVADTKANGGLRVASGSGAGTASGIFPTDGLTAGKCWRVDGIDTNVQGGWSCYIINPNGTPDFTTGSPNMAAAVWIAMGLRSTAAILDTTFNFCVDALRLGTGHTVNNGTSGAPVTLVDFDAFDNVNTTRYGVVYKRSGTFYIGGKLKIGTAGQTAITFFKEVSRLILFHDYPVDTTFYEIIVTGNATYQSTVQFGNLSGSNTTQGCTIRAIGASGFTLTANSNGSFLIYGSSVEGMKQATLNNLCTLKNTTINNSGTITSNGAVIDGCTFANGTNYAISIASTTEMSVVTNSVFEGHTVNPAVNITTIGTYTFDNLTFNGNTFDVDNNSGGLVTINIVNGGNTPTYRNGAGSSTVVNNAVTLKVTVKDEASFIVQNARVAIYKSSDNTELMNGLSNASGIVQTSFNFTTDTDIYIRVRKSSTGDTKYFVNSSTGTITASGYTSTVTLIEDNVVI